MSDMRDLYQEVILDHGKSPRNFRRLDPCNHLAHGHNPLCGDRIVVYADVQGGKLTDIGFQGDGCAISKASASMMTEAVKGLSPDEAKALFARFHDLVTATTAVADDEDSGLDKLAVFAGVRDYPVRVKCATLPWHTLVAALDKPGDTVKTE